MKFSFRNHGTTHHHTHSEPIDKIPNNYRESEYIFVIIIFMLANCVKFYSTGIFKPKWQNEWDDHLRVECKDKEGFTRVRSEHSNKREDRRWKWDCSKVAMTKFTKCVWSDYQNGYDTPILFQCPANHILSGIESDHSNKSEDRKWKFRCCVAKNHFTRNCFLTDYINDWDKKMDYTAKDYVFTGAMSFHSNHRE